MKITSITYHCMSGKRWQLAELRKQTQYAMSNEQDLIGIKREAGGHYLKGT